MKSIVSLGKSSALLQAMPTSITAAAAALNIEAAMLIDGVPYFAESDLAAIGEHLRSGRRG